MSPHAEHTGYRRLIKAESSSDVGSSPEEKNEKDDKDKAKKVAKDIIGPVEKAVEKSSESSYDGSGNCNFKIPMMKCIFSFIYLLVSLLILRFRYRPRRRWEK